jgi:hypothetical protein
MKKEAGYLFPPSQRTAKERQPAPGLLPELSDTFSGENTRSEKA